MADKKTTKRERREEARQRRLEEMRRRQRRARARKLGLWGVAALVVAGIVAAVMLTGDGGLGDEELQRLATAAGCDPIEKHPNQGASHEPPYEYTLNPPTSGNHNPRWAETGINSSPVPYENTVHNLEHGAVVIHYKADELDGEILDALEDAVRADPQWLLLTPNTTIPAPLTFSAWEHSQICGSPTTATAVAAALDAFVTERKDKGPESIPGTPTGI